MGGSKAKKGRKPIKQLNLFTGGVDLTDEKGNVQKCSVCSIVVDRITDYCGEECAERSVEIMNSLQ